MKIRIISIAISILCTMTLVAQEDVKVNSLSLNWGMGHVKRQDLSFSPMVHQKWSALNFALSYERSKKLEQEILVRFSHYTPQVGEPYEFNLYFNTEKFSTYPHTFTQFELNYSLGKNIVELGNFKMALGGKARIRFWPSNYMWGDNGSFGYYFSSGLDAWLKLEYVLNDKNHLRAHIGLPVFSFISRSPYMSQNDEYFADNIEHNDFKSVMNFLKRSEIQSWGLSQGVDLDVSYYHAFSGRWEIGASYWLSMNFNQAPTPLASIENTFFLSARLKF